MINSSLNAQQKNQNIAESINLLIYGCRIRKYQNTTTKSQSRIFFIDDTSTEMFLQWFSGNKTYMNSRIAISKIFNIEEQDSQNSQRSIKSNQLIEFQKAQFKLLILYQKGQSCLTLGFPSQQSRSDWKIGLEYFIQAAINQNNILKNQQISQNIAQKSFNQLDADGNQEVSMDEFFEVQKQLRIGGMDIQQIKQEFQKYDANRDNKLNLAEFQQYCKEKMQHEAIKQVYDNYAKIGSSENNNQFNKAQGQKEVPKSQSCLTQQQLILFLQNEQKEANCQQVIQQIYSKFKTNLIDYFYFSDYLYSGDNSIFNPLYSQTYQDMNLPLTDYYCCSSHNTYLTSHQLVGKSSLQAYIQAFARGCRCVELDCWDGDQEPIIKHGYTLTTEITFRSVVQTVKDYGFKFSRYPIILSLEVHCSVKQQNIMGQILMKILGNILFTLPSNYKAFKQFPSPTELAGKVIIKGKGRSDNNKLDFYNNNLEKIKTPDTSLMLEDVSQLMQSVTLLANGGKQQDQNQGVSNNTNRKSFSMFQNQQGGQSKNSKQEDKSEEGMQNILNSQVISLFGSEFSLQPAEIVNRSVWSISSIDENKLNNLILKNQNELILFHKSFFSRIYPSGIRINSSNYNPIPGFSVGSQVVALNFQTPDLNLLLYTSKFLENGGINSGYVLKPYWLRSATLNTKNPINFSSFYRPLKLLQIQVLSALYLRTAHEQSFLESLSMQYINPFVQITLRGLDIDEQNNLPKKTNTVENNCFNPQFNYNLFMKFNIFCPDQAIVLFEVLYADTFNNPQSLGKYALSFNCIREGYRVVPLYDEKLEIIENSFILVNIKISDYNYQ